VQEKFGVTLFKIETEIVDGLFISRPNRFVVKVEVNGVEVGASMPNPGRMQELLFYKTELLLAPMDTDRVKYPYRAIGVKSTHGWLMLDTIKTNDVAAYLVENRLVESLKEYTLVKREVTVGHSRFDLLLEKNGEKLYCEVKSCTLFGGNLAMFPDAVTERGRRHVKELREMSEKENIKTAVLFIVHSSEVGCFIPDFHNDPAFSEELYKSRNSLKIIPLSISWNRDLSLKKEVKELPIRWNIYEKFGLNDSGFYLILLEVKDPQTVNVGALGDIFFERGFYCYVGSAKVALSKRIKRHRAKRKRKHWHIDYLRDISSVAGVWPIRSDGNLECEIANRVRNISDDKIEKFGSSDCNCNSHLFYFKKDPVRTEPFQKVVIWYRMENFIA
jgi:sugar fermentation stimulation protein A